LPLGMPISAEDATQKADFIQSILSSVVQTNNYTIVEARYAIVDVDGRTEKVFSTGILALRNN